MAYPSNIPGWNQVKADFGDSNQAMSVASGAFSQAGNVFDKIFSAIQAERFKAMENERLDRTFEENKRQFNVGADLNERKFGLDTDKFGFDKDKELTRQVEWGKTFDEGVRETNIRRDYELQKLVDQRYTNDSTAKDMIPQYTNIASLSNLPTPQLDGVNTSSNTTNSISNASSYFSPEFIKQFGEKKIDEVVGYADYARRFVSGTDTEINSNVDKLLQGPNGGLITKYARENNIPPQVIAAVMFRESGLKGDANTTSPTGVKGPMQVTEETFKNLGFTGDRADPENSIKAGAKLLAENYKRYGNWEDAFVAYNGGGNAVKGMKNMRSAEDNPYADAHVDYSKMDPRLNATGRDKWEKKAQEQADRNAYRMATEFANNSAKGFKNQVVDIDRQLNELAGIVGTPEGDALESTRKDLLNQREIAIRNSAMATTESGRALLILDQLETMGRGDLTVNTRQKRAELELQHARELEKEKLKSNANWTKTLQDNKLNENKAAVQTAKILSGIEDGIIFGKYRTEAQKALAIARKLGVSEQQILEAFSSFSTKDDNWFFDTPMQDAIQQFNENQSGPFAEALKYFKNSANSGTTFKYGEGSDTTGEGNKVSGGKEVSPRLTELNKLANKNPSNFTQSDYENAQINITDFDKRVEEEARRIANYRNYKNVTEDMKNEAIHNVIMKDRNRFYMKENNMFGVSPDTIRDIQLNIDN